MTAQAADVETHPSSRLATTGGERGARGRPKAALEKIVLKRLQVKLTEKGFQRIELLKRTTEALTAADVVRDALRVYEALVEAVAQGKLVALEDPDDPSRREVVRLF